MTEETPQTHIGPYLIRKSIAKGGMGEVLLAYDPVCEREVALKRIRPDLHMHEVMRSRFLREAKITGQLTHPGIVAIYTIQHDQDQIYYTMPYVQGVTLRHLLRPDSQSSIPHLIPIFKSICQTIAYVHAKGIIHRDIKPENILVGTFGEVIILDWGLAVSISEPQEKETSLDSIDFPPELTHPGKIVGTLSYMAPERALGKSATILTDIYALGVILYLILTLRLPFERGTLKDFKKNHSREILLDPEEIAPYREVPPRLSRMVRRCLEPGPAGRYPSTEALIHDINGFLEGRSEWFESKRLSITRKKDWEFQENVLISKHIAITRATEEAEWVSLMLSKASFAENTRIETKVYIGKEGSGIGFLLSVPEISAREYPLEGYCLWIGSEDKPFSQLFRNTIKVMHLPDLFLMKNRWHTISIEKIDNYIHCFVDGIKKCTYLSYLPLTGTHVGLLYRDADFQMEEISVSVGSQNLQVSCLSIPDAFLASRDYKRALAEYRRIGYSFPGHAEGREALFRAGITLLEQAKNVKNEKKAQFFYSLALEEFSKLHQSPGAPLEYLGKSLVYQSLHDYSEEIKCLELALRRYHEHPVIGMIKEQILYRLHETSQKDRKATYQLILVTLRHLKETRNHTETVRLCRHLISHWEPLSFFENPLDPSAFGKEASLAERESNDLNFSISLAFWLASPHAFLEIMEDLLHSSTPEPALIGNALYALLEMGSYSLVKEWIAPIEAKKANYQEVKTDLEEMLAFFHLLEQESLSPAIKAFFAMERKDIGVREWRTLLYLIEQALRAQKEEYVHEIARVLKDLPLSTEDRISLDAYRVWAHLQKNEWRQAEEIFDTYHYELLNQESTLLHPLYGCWLYVAEGKELSDIHFGGVIDTPFPRSWALLGHELTNHLSENPTWLSNSFMWERRQLYAQLSLYYHCAGNHEMSAYFRHLEKKEYTPSI